MGDSAQRPLRLLVVDDDVVSMLVAEHILRGAGHDVATASSAAEARRLIGADGSLVDPAPVDVIVCDYHMPGESGLDLLDSLATSGRVVPPFILLTGVAEAAELADERVSGVTGFLTKPVQSEKLIAAVLMALRPGVS